MVFATWASSIDVAAPTFCTSLKVGKSTRFRKTVLIGIQEYLERHFLLHRGKIRLDFSDLPNLKSFHEEQLEVICENNNE